MNRPPSSPVETDAYARLKVKLKLHLADLLDRLPHGASVASQRPSLERSLQQRYAVIAAEYAAPQLSTEEVARLARDVIDEVAGLGPLEGLLTDETITEIMVNGPHEIFVERQGRLDQLTLRFNDAHHLLTVIERLLMPLGLTVNESSPLCDASLPDGARINVIIPPLALNGPVVTIRRKAREWTMAEYIATGALSQEAARFLEACVRARVNLVVSGGTSTGKTTLVAVLSGAVPREERIITIENVAELELQGRAHWIRLVAKAPNIEGRGEIPLRTLVRNALRMRPDRIILGEARGGEALDVVQAMHSGHDGFITVLHANTSRAALERLETLMLMSGLDLPPSACRVQIASAVELVVHLARFADGSRRVSAITQVVGVSPEEGFLLEDIFSLQVEGFGTDGALRGGCRHTGAKVKCLEKFRLNNVEVPAWAMA